MLISHNSDNADTLTITVDSIEGFYYSTVYYSCNTLTLNCGPDLSFENYGEDGINRDFSMCRSTVKFYLSTVLKIEEKRNLRT